MSADLEPIAGHLFETDLSCECGATWDSHRASPAPCPKAGAHGPHAGGRSHRALIANQASRRALRMISPRAFEKMGII